MRTMKTTKKKRIRMTNIKCWRIRMRVRKNKDKKRMTK